MHTLPIPKHHRRLSLTHVHIPHFGPEHLPHLGNVHMPQLPHMPQLGHPHTHESHPRTPERKKVGALCASGGEQKAALKQTHVQFRYTENL